MARMPYPPIGLWLRGYGKNAIPSYWSVVAWVWQGCHTLLLVCGCVGMARMPYPPIITHKPSSRWSAVVLCRP